MRCDDVIRELAVPTDDRNTAVLSEHLANCSSCTDWAKRAAQLDRLWDATRPAEPSPEAWDAVWSHVVCSLDSSTAEEVKAFSLPMVSSNGSSTKVETPVVLTRSSSHARRWNWAAISLIGVAQAAAILLAVALTWHQSTRAPEPAIAKVGITPAFAPEPVAPGKMSGSLLVGAVEIEEGRVVVIRVDDSMAKVVDLTPQAASYRLEKSLRNLESPLVDDWLLMLNEVESMPNSIVAMKE
jgi:hypothetical protein